MCINSSVDDAPVESVSSNHLSSHPFIFCSLRAVGIHLFELDAGTQYAHGPGADRLHDCGPHMSATVKKISFSVPVRSGRTTQNVVDWPYLGHRTCVRSNNNRLLGQLRRIADSILICQWNQRYSVLVILLPARFSAMACMLFQLIVLLVLSITRLVIKFVVSRIFVSWLTFTPFIFRVPLVLSFCRELASTKAKIQT